MKKKIATLFVAMLVLLPKTSRADLDVLSIVQDNLKVFQEKANTVVQGYIGIQSNLQEVALSRDVLGTLRDTVKEEMTYKLGRMKSDLKEVATDSAMEFANSQLSTVMIPGINNSISLGPYTSPVLKQKVGKAYIKRTNQESDVAVNARKDNEANKQMVENLATIYANAIVRRKQLIDGEQIGCDNVVEKSEESASATDVSTLQYNYGLTARRANCRWLEIMRFEASYRQALSTLYMTRLRVGDISEIIGIDENKVDTEGMNDVAAEVIGERKSIDILAMKEKFKQGLDAAKDGDYASALNAASSAYGIAAVEGNQKLVNVIQTGASGAGSAYNAAQRGDWGGVVGATGNAVGNSIGGNAGTIVSTASRGADGAMSAATRGDWGGVVGATGGAVGSSMGGNLGNIVSTASSGADRAMNAAQRGDWGGVVGATGGAVGKSMGGNVGNIVSTASSGADRAMTAATRGDWGNVVGAAGSAVGNSVGGEAGKVISTAASGADDAYSSAQNGKWGNVIGEAGRAAGVAMGDETGDIVSAATTGVGAVYNVYDAVSESAESTISAIGKGEYGDAANSGKKAVDATKDVLNHDKNIDVFSDMMKSAEEERKNQESKNNKDNKNTKDGDNNGNTGNSNTNNSGGAKNN